LSLVIYIRNWRLQQCPWIEIVALWIWKRSHSERVWDPLNLLSNGYQGLFPWG
jgi:hypothetical protein